MSRIFTSLVTESVELQHDPPHRVTIRKLAPKHLREARLASLARAMEELRLIGSPAVLKELRELDGRPTESESPVTQPLDGRGRDPLTLYDRDVLIRRGIVSWTYDRPMDDAALEDLDEQTADLLARAILRLTKPELFEEQEADRKNA